MSTPKQNPPNRPNPCSMEFAKADNGLPRCPKTRLRLPGCPETCREYEPDDTSAPMPDLARLVGENWNPFTLRVRDHMRAIGCSKVVGLRWWECKGWAESVAWVAHEFPNLYEHWEKLGRPLPVEIFDVSIPMWSENSAGGGMQPIGAVDSAETSEPRIVLQQINSPGAIANVGGSKNRIAGRDAKQDVNSESTETAKPGKEETSPKGIWQAILQWVWSLPRTWRTIVIIAIVIILALLAIWKSLPEKTKVWIIGPRDGITDRK